MTAQVASQVFRYITLPLLMPVLAVTTVLNLLYGLKVFDIVFVLTNGGPGRATDTVYTAIFDEFSKGQLRRGHHPVNDSLPYHDRAGLFCDPDRCIVRRSGDDHDEAPTGELYPIM